MKVKSADGSVTDDKNSPVTEGQDNSPAAASWKSISDVAKERFTKENLQKHSERLKTGFVGLDNALGGGIYPGLIVLGGSPGVGKSTFALQIAESVSERVPVLYFSMEMTRERIAAKFISRYLYEHREELGLNEDNLLTADELISGMPEQNPWGKTVLEAVEKARLHVESVTKKLFINVKRMNAERMVREVEKFIEEHGDPPFPLVMVDYLQILPPANDKELNEKKIVEESLHHMVGLAHKENREIPVILLSSLSRGSYKKPMEIDSFKETGGIEYSADLLIGLQFQACHDEKDEKKIDLDKERDRNPRKVELTILKQRYGKSGNTVKLEYDAAHDCLWEEEKAAVESQEKEVDRSDRLPGAVMCNTMVANEIRKGAYSTGFPIGYTVMPSVTTTCKLTKQLNCFDCDVADTIYTMLAKEKREYFSVGQVLRTLSGDERQNITEKARKKVEKSLERLQEAEITINCEEEMKKREKTEDTQFKQFSGKFLNVRQEKRKYFFETGDPAMPMPLYAYGEKTNQMISFPRELLYIPANNGRKMHDNRETICIKRYLIRRLEILRNKQKGGKQNNKDGFRTISFRADGELFILLNKLAKPYEDENEEKLAEDGNEEKARQRKQQKQRKLKEIIKTILEYYIKIKYIQAYKVQESTQSVRIEGTVRNPWKLNFQAKHTDASESGQMQEQ